MNYDLYLGGGGSADAVARTVSEAQEISFWPSLGLVDNGKNYEKNVLGGFCGGGCLVLLFTFHVYHSS